MFFNFIDFQDHTLYFIILGGVLIILVFIVMIRMLKKPTKESISVDALISELKSDNITKIAFIRHKINITLKNPKAVDYEALKALGVQGINIVGDTVKFYFESDNEEIYEALKSKIES